MFYVALIVLAFFVVFKRVGGTFFFAILFFDAFYLKRDMLLMNNDRLMFITWLTFSGLMGWFLGARFRSKKTAPPATR